MSLGRRAGPGHHCAPPGRLELVHPAQGPALRGHRSGSRGRRPPGAHPGGAARASHRGRRLALCDRRRRQTRDVGRHVLELSADLPTRLRPRLGDGGGRLRIRGPHAIARSLPRAPVGGARRRGPQPCPAPRNHSIASRAGLGAPLVYRRSERDAGRMVGYHRCDDLKSRSTWWPISTTGGCWLSCGPGVAGWTEDRPSSRARRNVTSNGTSRYKHPGCARRRATAGACSACWGVAG